METGRNGSWGNGGNGRGGATSAWRDGLSGFVDGFAHGRRSGDGQGELIASLNEVAEAVSRALNTEEVLNAIVERAKRVTNTDKAAVILADEHDGSLFLDTVVVRGRRGQHPQEWWQSRLESLGDQLWARSGSAVEHHPDQDAWFLWSPIRVKDHRVGVLCAINTADRPFTQLDIDFMSVLSAFAASSIENARLAEQSRHVLLASERDRIAREMHDGVVQSLFSISLGLELCKKRVDRDPQGVIVRLDELQSHLNESMTELRRFIYDLRPVKLTELGLGGAIEYWIGEVTRGRSLRGRLVVDGDVPRLTPWEESCLYRVAKESVSNVVKHSAATQFEVRLGASDGLATMAVSDDGCGFDVQSAVNGSGIGIGLHSIRERVSRLGGTLRVDSAPGMGTTITVLLQPGGGNGSDQRSDS